MKTLFFLLWPLLTLFTTGCYTMSRTQCAKGTRIILVSNLLIDTLEEGDSTVVVNCNGIDRTLLRDESFEIIQKCDKNLTVPAIEITIHWRGLVKKVFYPAVTLSPHFFGPQEPIDLFLGRNLNDLVLVAF